MLNWINELNDEEITTTSRCVYIFNCSTKLYEICNIRDINNTPKIRFDDYIQIIYTTDNNITYYDRHFISKNKINIGLLSSIDDLLKKYTFETGSIKALLYFIEELFINFFSQNCEYNIELIGNYIIKEDLIKCIKIYMKYYRTLKQSSINYKYFDKEINTDIRTIEINKIIEKKIIDKDLYEDEREFHGIMYTFYHFLKKHNCIEQILSEINFSNSNKCGYYLYRLIINDNLFSYIDFDIFVHYIKIFEPKELLIYITALFDNNCDNVNLLEQLFNLLFHNHKSDKDLVNLMHKIIERMKKIDNENWIQDPIKKLFELSML